MNYQRIYNELINNRKTNLHNKSTYTEKHHIVPKSHGGSNSKDNLVYLSAREHFIAHWLLWRIHRDSKMAYAFNSMSADRYGKRYKNSYGFEEARKAYVSTVTGRVTSDNTKAKLSIANKGRVFSQEHRDVLSKAATGRKLSDEHKNSISINRTGIKHTQESKDKMSKARTGKSTKLLGQHLSNEHKNKISYALTGRIASLDTREKLSKVNIGKRLSEEHKLKLSLAKLGKKKAVVVCPHCNKEGGKPIMTRFHFDNCKELIN